MGSCETSLLPHQVHNDPRNWEYISLSPCLGHTFRHERDGLSNLIIVKQKKYELHQGVFSTFPQKEEHAMGDLFEPHPLLPDLWRFRARVDDIISFTTAEKLNPISMESTIQANPLVKSAVIGGQGQFQASLLIEPREYPKNAAEEEAFFNQIWPSIAQANQACPAHGRIMKGFVMLTDPTKPLPRASKDTVQRHAVFKLYEAEWKSLYERLAQSNQLSKEPAERSSMASAKTNGYHPSQNSPGVSLPDDIALKIEAMVNQKVAAALGQFASVLLAAANQLKSGDSPTNGYISKPADESSPQALLRKRIYDTLAENLEVGGITDDTDLFEYGLDSIQVPPLLNAINAFIIKSEQPVDLIDSKAIYANMTVKKLVTAALRSII